MRDINEDAGAIGTSEINSRFIFQDSTMVVHSAVNRKVVGSSPTLGATSMKYFSELLG